MPKETMSSHERWLAVLRREKPDRVPMDYWATSEATDNLRILGQGGGYILAPCHNIQAVSPPENIMAMYETGYEYGWSVASGCG